MHGSTYNKAKFRYLALMWIIRRHRPFAIIGDSELQDMFRMLYNKVDILSARTISRDAQEVFQMSKINIARILQAYLGKLHLGLDGWTSPNVISFLGVVVYMVRDDRITSCILDFLK